MNQKNSSSALATFGAGCFWGVQALFDKTLGVISTRVGYTGGTTGKPTYHQVCTDTTGHAEAVEVVYDPRKVTYEHLLQVFWENHNPTTPNQQGPDFGSQYRSVIFYHSPAQKKTAETSKKTYQKKMDKKIVTEIVPAMTFYPAEDYHQKYLEKRGLVSCHI